MIDVVKHSESLDDLVLYKCLYDNKLSSLWVRPLEMFLGDVVIEGEKRPRFKPIGD